METDWKKKYEEALSKARAGKSLEEIFPELKESEDERIRKELLEEIEFIIPHADETDSEGLILPSYHARIDRYKSYLEKQKEQKPADVAPNQFDGITYGMQGCSTEKPAEWSEEDEVYLQDALWCVKQAAKVARGENDMGTCWSAERWLKSLRPQPHWKSSDEQPEVDLEVRKQIEELANDWHHKGFASDEDCPLCMQDLMDILWHFYELGKKDMKEQMLQEAVEGYVNYYEDSGGILMAEAQVGCPYHNGDKVRLIIVKEE